MKYLTGLYAVNIEEPSHDTATDWHCAALDWENPPLAESENSVFADWGITKRAFSICDFTYDGYIANHVRACLDMLETGMVTQARGMRNDYIGNEKFTPTIMEKALMLKDCPHWVAIDDVMGREYGVAWLDMKERHCV